MAHKSTGDANEDGFCALMLCLKRHHEAAWSDHYFSQALNKFCKNKEHAIIFLRDQDSQAETHKGEGEKVCHNKSFRAVCTDETCTKWSLDRHDGGGVLKSMVLVEHGLEEPDYEDTKYRTVSSFGHIYDSEQCTHSGCIRAAWFWKLEWSIFSLR